MSFINLFLRSTSREHHGYPFFTRAHEGTFMKNVYKCSRTLVPVVAIKRVCIGSRRPKFYEWEDIVSYVYVHVSTWTRCGYDCDYDHVLSRSCSQAHEGFKLGHAELLTLTGIGLYIIVYTSIPWSIWFETQFSKAIVFPWNLHEKKYIALTDQRSDPLTTFMTHIHHHGNFCLYWFNAF